VPNGDCGKQVCREGSDAALSRQVVADECDLADLGSALHEFNVFIPKLIPVYFRAS
jgi:hypothetical protein